MALLDDGLIKLSDTVNTGTNGVKYFYETPMTDHGSYGKISFEGVFAHSSNIGVSMMVNEHYGKRPERFIEKLKQFGLLDPKLAQIKGEPLPDVVSPKEAERWSGTTLPWMSIGYNTQLTPLQILSFYNAVANNGQLMQPYLVSEVRKNAKVLEKYGPVVLNKRIAGEKTLADAHKLLESVVDYGTAVNIKTKKYKIAGKTGTAKKVVNGEYQQRYQASFCGFFPADNPKYSLYILVDEPRKSTYYGGSVAAPIFRSIADQVYAMDLAMMPPRTIEAATAGARPVTRRVDQLTAEKVYQHLNIHTPTQPETRWVRVKQTEGKVEYSPMEVGSGTVPDVTGMSAKDAVALLGSLGMQVHLRGSGKVKEQSLEAGSRIEPRKVISLTLE
jgi:cell division protein FtsI (penicillin-binding protein 3)